MNAPAQQRSQLLRVARAELVAQRRSLLAWLVPTAGLLAASLSVQPQMARDGSLLQAKLDLLPREMLVAFGMGQGLTMSDPVAYLAINFVSPMLLGALFAGLLGAGLFSREEQARTAELLLVQPVTRTTVVLGKLLLAVLLVIVFDAVLTVVAMGTYAAVDVGDYDRGRVALIFVGAAVAHLSLLTVALLASALQRSPRGALPTGLGLVFGTYSAGVVAAISQTLEPLGLLSPFRAVDPSTIAKTGALPPGAYALLIVMLAATALSIARIERKDLRA